MFGGLDIIESHLMAETVEDWSEVRSPARAKRRRRLGHPQRIRLRLVPLKEAVQIGNTLVMHPAMAAELRRAVAVSARPPA